MPAPVATVLVTTFNHDKYVAQCLQSIVDQHVDFPLQILVVDDGSSDATPQIIQKYADRYPHLIEPVLLAENMGLCIKKFRDITLSRVKGRYLAFCEGDDYWTHHDKLKRQVQFLENNSDYSACFCLYSIVNEAGLPNPFLPRLRKSRRIDARLMILEHLAHMVGFVARTAAIKDNPKLWQVYDNVKPYTDILLFACVADAGKVYAFSSRMAAYRIHSRGLFSSSKLKQSGDKTAYVREKTLIDAWYGPCSAMAKWMNLYENLEKWTLLRRRKKILAATVQLFHAFIYNPRLFLRLYFDRYLK